MSEGDIRHELAEVHSGHTQHEYIEAEKNP
jgi:hypothetical protein